MLRNIGVIFAIILTGCVSDAPRINPLDPAHGLETGFLIRGKVERLSGNAAIENATLTVKEMNLSVKTNANGEYSIDANIAAGQYILLCEAANFAADSINLTLNTEKEVNADFQLNALPRFNQISLRTRHEAKFFPPDDFFLEIAVAAEDGDTAGLLDLVWYEIESMGFVDTLQFLPQAQIYFKRLKASDFGVLALESLLGKPFKFFVKDANGAVVFSEEKFITRIIDPTPRTISPLGNTTIPFEFTWQAIEEFLTPYPFTFSIEIFLNVNIALPPEDVIENISASQTSIHYNGSLPPGSYFWVLYIVDEFGNRSRSIPTELTIQ